MSGSRAAIGHPDFFTLQQGEVFYLQQHSGRQLVKILVESRLEAVGEGGHDEIAEHRHRLAVDMKR